MGQQLTIKKEIMEAAGWTAAEVVVVEGYWDTTQYDNYGEEPEWVPPLVDRVWTHPQKGSFGAYPVSSGDFFADCNPWGSNRALFEEAGLLDLEHCLG